MMLSLWLDDTLDCEIVCQGILNLNLNAYQSNSQTNQQGYLTTLKYIATEYG